MDSRGTGGQHRAGGRGHSVAIEMKPTYPTSTDEIDANSNLLFLHHFQGWLVRVLHGYKKPVQFVLISLLLVGYGVYFFFALKHSIQEATALIVITSIVLFLIAYVQIRNRFGHKIWQVLRPIRKGVSSQKHHIIWIACALILIGLGLFLILDVVKSSKQLVSLAGILLLLLIPLVTSKHVTRIRWRPVVWGMSLQLLLGILVLRWRPGYLALKFVSDEFNKFLTYSLAGAAMAFGDPWFFLHPFVFMVAPMLIFIGAVTGLFFHIGVTQIIVSKMAWLTSKTVGTTAIESSSLVANVFFSNLDLIQMFKAYIPKLTQSEFHAFIVGSHSSIAGFAYGLFIIFGVNPLHLMTAAIMSPPAAVAISKLNFPETDNSLFNNEEDCEPTPSKDRNGVEAIASGAWTAGKTVITLLVQLLAFMSLFEWIDTTVIWLGARVGAEISLRKLFSYVFIPFAYVIGVDPEDVEKVSSVVGLKLVTSEILAYMELGQLRSAGAISERSAALTTYAICGFSSMGTLFMMIPVWTVVDKEKAHEATSMLFRIFINCNIACFLTSSIAGLLYNDNLLEVSAERGGNIFLALMGGIPSYKDILRWL